MVRIRIAVTGGMPFGVALAYVGLILLAVCYGLGSVAVSVNSPPESSSLTYAPPTGSVQFKIDGVDFGSPVAPRRANGPTPGSRSARSTS